MGQLERFVCAVKLTEPSTIFRSNETSTTYKLLSTKHVRFAPMDVHIATVRVSCGGVCRALAEIAERVRLIGRYRDTL